MATVNLVGFESADLLECSSTSGTVGVQNGTARNGGYALRANPTGFGTGYAVIRGVAADGSGAGAAADKNFVRFYFRFAALPAASQVIFLLEAPGPLTKSVIYLKSTGVLRLEDSFLSGVDGATALSAGVWYRLNVGIESGASGATMTLAIDGVGEISTTGNTSATAASQIKLGRISGPGEDVDYYFDDVRWDDASIPGAGQIVALLPSADGTFANGTANGAGTKWGCLLDRPNDGDTTYVNGVGNTNSYVAHLDLGSISVTSGAKLKGVVVAKNDGMSGGNLKVRIYEPGASGSQSSTGAVAGASYVALCKIAEGPAAGGSWTDAALSGVEAGVIENSANASRFTAIYGMLDYVPAPPPTTQR